MGEMNHTPEPWRLGRGDSSDDHMCTVTTNHPNVAMQHVICRTWSPYYQASYPASSIEFSRKEQIANARRIVACVNACEGINPEAVPDLLEACEAYADADAWDNARHYSESIQEMKRRRVPIHNRWANRIIENLGYPHFNDSQQLRDLARELQIAAIAKAKGEESWTTPG
jgi:hypothetical protein